MRLPENQPQFSFKAEVTDDRVYAGDRKLQYGLDVEAFFRRPDKLRLNGDGDLESKQLIFDGKTLTLYDKDKNHYGTIDIASDIDAALDKAGKEYGVHVGLAELGANHLAEHANQGLTNALYVGESKVRASPATTWPSTRKKSITSCGSRLEISRCCARWWSLRKSSLLPRNGPCIFLIGISLRNSRADSLFTFTPPEGAQKIKFMPVKKAEAPAPQKAKPKKKGGAS